MRDGRLVSKLPGRRENGRPLVKRTAAAAGGGVLAQKAGGVFEQLCGERSWEVGIYGEQVKKKQVISDDVVPFFEN